tara:strand:- start:12684 stop:13226 length:543 start_codon:yes stop_codon:yes gene_type:complete
MSTGALSPEKLPDIIITHNTDRSRTHPELGYRRHLLLYHMKSGLGLLPPPEKHKGGVLAWINGGRWVVGCDICRTAVVAEPTDPWFCCPSCGSGGYWRRVVFPVNKQIIEALLLMRPGFRHSAPKRNWELLESLEDLRRQNVQAGDKVDQPPKSLDTKKETLIIEPGDVASIKAPGLGEV